MMNTATNVNTATNGLWPLAGVVRRRRHDDGPDGRRCHIGLGRYPIARHECRYATHHDGDQQDEKVASPHFRILTIDLLTPRACVGQ